MRPIPCQFQWSGREGWNDTFMHTAPVPSYDMFKHCLFSFSQLCEMEGGTHFFIWRNWAPRRLDRGKAGKSRPPLFLSQTSERDCVGLPNDNVLILFVWLRLHQDYRPYQANIRVSDTAEGMSVSLNAWGLSQAASCSESDSAVCKLQWIAALSSGISTA